MIFSNYEQNPVRCIKDQQMNGARTNGLLTAKYCAYDFAPFQDYYNKNDRRDPFALRNRKQKDFMTEHPSLQNNNGTKSSTIRPALRKTSRFVANHDIRRSASTDVASITGPLLNLSVSHNGNDSQNNNYPCPHLDTDSLDRELGLEKCREREITRDKSGPTASAIRDRVIERPIADSQDRSVTTHLEFTCMTQQEYDQDYREYDGCMPQDPAFIDDESDDTSQDETVLVKEPTWGPFMKLWNTLSQWITHDTVRLIASWTQTQYIQSPILEDDSTYQSINSIIVEKPPQEDRVVARYQGLMAMLKIHWPSCLEDMGFLQYESITHKFTEERLRALIGTFDLESNDMTLTSQYLDSSALWRVFTFILLEIALPYPPLLTHHIQSTMDLIGLSSEEYTYLTKQAIRSLCNI